MFKIRANWHAQDLWKLARCCEKLHLLCPPDTLNLPGTALLIEFQSSAELWNPLRKTVLHKYSMIRNKGHVNIWNYLKFFICLAQSLQNHVYSLCRERPPVLRDHKIQRSRYTGFTIICTRGLYRSKAHTRGQDIGAILLWLQNMWTAVLFCTMPTSCHTGPCYKMAIYTETKNVVILMKFSSLAALGVLILTTSSTANDDVASK